jgi:hypothetical protein
MKLLVLAVFAIAFSFVAAAQETRKYADIDCAQSKIMASAGFKCRATQEYAGSDSEEGDAGGTFRRWIAYGKGADGSNLYVYVFEALNGWTRPNATLESTVRGFNRDFQSATGFTPVAHLSDGDYQRFTDPKGSECVAIRKLGTSHSAGYKWLLLAGKCLPKGKSISDQDIAQFMEATGVRS